jgi:hypothetical protein
MHGLTPGPLAFGRAARSCAHVPRTERRCPCRAPKAGQMAPLTQPPARFTRVRRGSVDLSSSPHSTSTDGPLASQAQPRPGRQCMNSSRHVPPAEGRPQTGPANGGVATAAFSPPAQSPLTVSAGGPSHFLGLAFRPSLRLSSSLTPLGTDGHPQKHEPRVCACRARSTRSRPLDDGLSARFAATTARAGEPRSFTVVPAAVSLFARRNGPSGGMPPPTLGRRRAFQVHGLAPFVRASLFPSAARGGANCGTVVQRPAWPLC